MTLDRRSYDTPREDIDESAKCARAPLIMPPPYVRLVLLVVAAAVLAGCGAGSIATSTSQSQHMASSERSSPRAGGSRAQTDVCSLLAIQQIDAVLGTGAAPWTPTPELPNGYFSGTLLHDEVDKNLVHQADPEITLNAYAACSWQNHAALLPNTTASDPGYPEVGFVLTTWSTSVSEALYFKSLYKTNDGGFDEHIAGLGQWADYSRLSNEIVAGVGDNIVIIANDYGDPQEYSRQLQTQYTQLMKVMVSKLE